MSTPELHKRKQTVAETYRLLEQMGVTRADIGAVVDASPPLTAGQRERIAVISQPVLRRLRNKAREAEES